MNGKGQLGDIAFTQTGIAALSALSAPPLTSEAHRTGRVFTGSMNVRSLAQSLSSVSFIMLCICFNVQCVIFGDL